MPAESAGMSLDRSIKVRSIMKVERVICVAGNVIDVTVKVPSGRHSDKRARKAKVTSDMVQKNNEKVSSKKADRMINANFNSDCYHCVLSYEGIEPDLNTAMHNFELLLGRLRRRMKKAGLCLKWFAVVEFDGERVHHHFITNAPLYMIRESWTFGNPHATPLWEDSNYQRLASYIIKETSKTFRRNDCPFKCRFSHSRNLIIPVEMVEEVEERMLFADPVAFKGYYIDQDSVRRYEHPITGLQHLEYVMISKEDKPRIRKYYKGKRRTRDIDYSKYINYEEEQLNLLNYIIRD